MFIARWQIDARFGQKDKVIELMRKWETEVGAQAGLGEIEHQLLTGSIGAREATIEENHRVASLAQLEELFAKIGSIPAHAAWGKELEPHVVSGSSRWQIFRVV